MPVSIFFSEQADFFNEPAGGIRNNVVILHLMLIKVSLWENDGRKVAVQVGVKISLMRMKIFKEYKPLAAKAAIWTGIFLFEALFAWWDSMS